MKVGDVVRLKSSVSLDSCMTIDKMTNNGMVAECVWFDSNGVFNRQSFSVDSLKLLNENKPMNTESLLLG